MRTPLYGRHVQLGAKIVDFAGWEMPLQYSSILLESRQVRQEAGIFDVSHMGRISIEGKDSEKFLDYLSTNLIAGKKELSATYTVWCSQNGGAVDDLIIYKIDSEHFFVICNAANREKDFAHLVKESKPFDVTLKDHFEREGIIAVQGPLALPLVQKIIPEVKDLKPMRFLRLNNLIVAGTGYTGAGGCEIYAPQEKIIELWDAFTNSGVIPAGLGARDALRLEKGYALYGHELSDEIAPTESVAAWAVRLEKPTFLGKEALLNLKNKRSQWGILLEDKAIARAGHEVYLEGKKIGTVTSGTFSPTLERGIAIVLSEIPLTAGSEVTVPIRNKHAKAKVATLPFV